VLPSDHDFMREMSMERNNGLISVEKETSVIRSPYNVPDISVGENAGRICALRAGS
jgi:hypothetical protein